MMIWMILGVHELNGCFVPLLNVQVLLIFARLPSNSVHKNYYL